MRRAYLGLGSNVGDRARNLRRAIEELDAAGVRVGRVSPLYETEPVGYMAQGWFLNAVAEVRSDLFPRQLLGKTQAVERKLGRRRGVRNGPRTIDIDILLWGNRFVRAAGLEIPHPRYRERRFVLAPLADLAPGLHDPVTGETVRELLERAPALEMTQWRGPGWRGLIR